MDRFLNGVVVVLELAIIACLLTLALMLADQWPDIAARWQAWQGIARHMGS